MASFRPPPPNTNRGERIPQSSDTAYIECISPGTRYPRLLYILPHLLRERLPYGSPVVILETRRTSAHTRSISHHWPHCPVADSTARCPASVQRLDHPQFGFEIYQPETASSARVFPTFSQQGSTVFVGNLQVRSGWSRLAVGCCVHLSFSKTLLCTQNPWSQDAATSFDFSQC